MQQEQMNQMGMPDGDTQQNELADDEATDATPATDEKTGKMQDAKAQYDLLKKKKNRTLQDEAKLRSVTQILARNK